MKIEDPNPKNSDLREEYANAFRTDSYNDFWAHVLALNNNGHLMAHKSLGSSTAARLPSYRLFAEQLLDPDQPTVTQILGSIRLRPEILTLLRDYFSSTSDASHLCGLLLKDIDHIRKRYKSLKDPFELSRQNSARLPNVLTQVAIFSQTNPFSPSASSVICFQAVQSSCSSLLKQLELRRDKARRKAQRFKRLKCSSAMFVTAVTASLVVVIAAHVLVLVVAAPGVVTAWLELTSLQKLGRWAAQLDMAAKGTYILIRDLDTVSRLVARLNNEMEHVSGLMKVWVKRDDRLAAGREMASWFKKNEESVNERLDELEEHLYLCFMTINRGRNLVVKEMCNS